MEKVEVLKEFSYHGNDYSEGDTLELVWHVACQLINRGYVKQYELASPKEFVIKEKEVTKKKTKKRSQKSSW